MAYAYAIVGTKVGREKPEQKEKIFQILMEFARTLRPKEDTSVLREDVSSAIRDYVEFAYLTGQVKSPRRSPSVRSLRETTDPQVMRRRGYVKKDGEWVKMWNVEDDEDD